MYDPTLIVHFPNLQKQRYFNKPKISPKWWRDPVQPWHLETHPQRFRTEEAKVRKFSKISLLR